MISFKQDAAALDPLIDYTPAKKCLGCNRMKLHLSPSKIIKRSLPFVDWLPQYDKEKAISDLIAGVTVGLTLIPQGIAYAPLAGLAPEYGLYASLCGGLIYAIFGAVPEISIAPNAVLAIITLSFINHVSFGVLPAAVLLCFLSGVISFLCGVFRLGFLVDFVSVSVVSGFISAGAVAVASSQVKSVLGLKFPAESFLDIWQNVFVHINETKLWDCVLCAFSVLFLLLLEQLKRLATSNPDDKESATRKKIFWFIWLSRNAIVVLTGGIIAFVLSVYDLQPFEQTMKVPAGFPEINLPPMEVQVGNSTVGFFEMVGELGSGIFVVTLVAIVGNVTLAKACVKGKPMDASQEMMALGLCNIISSFISSFPINAAFVRAAISAASGMRTPMGGIYTSLMVLLSLLVLTPYFSYIPKATLGSVIIYSVIQMVTVTIIKPMWKINKLDLIPLWATFLVCLLVGFQYGIIVGIALDIILVMYYSARPKIVINKMITADNLEYVRVTPTSHLLFLSVEKVRKSVMAIEADANFKCPVVVDCSYINKTDFTAVKCLNMLNNDLKLTGMKIVFFKLKPALCKGIFGKNSSGFTADSEIELEEVLKNLDNS